MNKFSNSKKLFETFSIAKEAYKIQKTGEEGEDVEGKGEGVSDGTTTTIKAGSMTRLNDHINPVLCDMDPDQCVEAEYMNKKNQVFSWKFLRAVMCMIPISKLTKEQTRNMMMKSEIEEIAKILHEQALKRPCVLEEEEGAGGDDDDDFKKFMEM